MPHGARFGVISDLDDTVVRSSATNVLKMAWIVYATMPTRGFLRGRRRLLQGFASGPGQQVFQPGLLRV